MGKIAKSVPEPKSRRAIPAGKQPLPPVPGPTGSNAANLLLVDVVVRMGTVMLRRGAERVFFRGALGEKEAKEIARKRTLPQKLATIAIARVGTTSLPGAALVTAGLAATTVYQRRRADRFEQALAKLNMRGKDDTD